MKSYECLRCEYVTQYRNTIIKHLNRNKKCERTNKSLKYTDDELFKLSLIPIKNGNRNIIDEPDNEIDNNDNKDLKINISNNDLLNDLKNIHKNNILICFYCNNNFNSKKLLKNHIINFCKKIKIDNTKKINDSTSNMNDSLNNTNTHSLNTSSTNSYNTSTSTNNSNNSNNITVNLEISKDDILNIIPFDKVWDTSHLSFDINLKVYLSVVKFSKSFEYTLKNNSNINILFEKETNTWYVYKDNKIIKMVLIEIVDVLFVKVRDNLINLSNKLTVSTDFQIDPNIILRELDIINKKTDDYYNNEEVRKTVQGVFTTILEKHHDAAKINFITIQKHIEKTQKDNIEKDIEKDIEIGF